jgi:phage baseplate assembly protein W
MPTFVGFSTQHVSDIKTPVIAPGVDGGGINPIKKAIVTKKFTMTDEQLVIQDLINSFNIIAGQKPGQPSYGTTIWSFIFEANTLDTRSALEAEIRRVANLDPRIVVNTVEVLPQDNGVLAQVELAISPFNNPSLLAIMFDQNASRAYSITNNQ